MSNSLRPMDCSLPGSFVHEISQARILEWVAIFFSRESSQLGIKLTSPALAGRFFTTELPEKPVTNFRQSIKNTQAQFIHKQCPCENLGGFIQALSTVPGTQSGLSKLCTCWWVSATLLQDCEETGADPPHLWGNISDSSATVQLWGLESLKSSSSSESRMDPFLSLSVFSSS